MEEIITRVDGLKLKNVIGKTRTLMDLIAFLLLLCSMVWVVLIYQNLPDRFPLAFDNHGKISEWGTPLHFMIVFCAGMLVYSGLTGIARSRNLFGVSIFLAEHRGRIKYEATLLLFSLLKALSLALFLTVMYNMYASVHHRDMQPVEWAVFLIAGLILLVIAVYFIAVTGSHRKNRHRRPASE